MLEKIHDFPAQIQSAWSLINGLELDLPPRESIDRVLVLGMGGSAIAGDLVAALAEGQSKVGLSVHRGYGLPAWVDQRTLVIASSFSGNTEETLSGWKRACQIDAPRFAITTGGELAQQADPSHTIRFDYDAQPRAALGFSFTLLLALMARIGLILKPTDELAAAVKALKSAAEPSASTKAMLKHVDDGIPVTLAAEHLAPVARRWSTQINENSKSWAFWNEYPELDHNLIVGLGFPKSIVESKGLRVIQLLSDHYHPQIKRRIQITGELMQAAGIPVFDYSLEKKASRLSEMLQMINKGDYLSYYLAEKYKVDPTPVPEIETLKARLAEQQ
jgi:glucose/mannose-6-phosphate isomerase